MLGKKSLINRTGISARAIRSGSVIAQAAASAVCESLEARRLLATYTVPPDHEAAYLQEGPEPGQVIVRLDSPTGSIAHTFTNTSGQHVVNAGENEDFLFVDQVMSSWKPPPAFPEGGGIKVIGAGNATLLIDASEHDNDRGFIVVDQPSIDLLKVSVIDFTTSFDADTFIGDGVSHIIIRTPDVEASQYYQSFPWPEPQNPGGS